LIIAIINTFQSFDLAYTLTGGGPGTRTTTIVLYIYKLAFQEFSQGYASAVSIVLFLIIGLMTVIQFRVQRRWVHYE
jgi:multiple sugar transport system permease protein